VIANFTEKLIMRPAWAPFRALCILILGLAAASCAGMAGDTLAKEKMEALLNAELKTGDDASTIEAFFQRHEIPYTYDASIRRYFGTAATPMRPPLSVYIYTDTDKKMTVTLVQAPKPDPAARPERRMPNYLDLPGNTASGPPRF
jgi:hypothetical protein